MRKNIPIKPELIIIPTANGYIVREKDSQGLSVCASYSFESIKTGGRLLHCDKPKWTRAGTGQVA